MVYDITKRSSFLSIQRWMEEVKRYTHPQVALILIGNKSDMERLREVEKAEVQRLVEMWALDDNSMVHSLEVSAKENTNIDETFMLLAQKLKAGHDSSRELSAADHICLTGSKSVTSPWQRCSSLSCYR
ncbi:ras-related protein Rab-43 [Hyalella azteca]|uniref:Ras-related protein Rab-43 n=1 Tax=Hyalella azteca TaxID=294128 RepID=A0A8B7P893_HYAAZ|nr:ras-related protein Rab-43 [Hyalella azteca]